MKKRLINGLVLVVVLFLVISMTVISTVSVGAYYIPNENEFISKLNNLRNTYGSTYSGNYYENGSWKAGQCHGYANQLAHDIFGSTPYTGNGGWQKSWSMGTIYAGDIVRIYLGSYEHTIFVTKVSGDNIYFTDANYDWNNGIRWDQCYSIQTLAGKFIYKQHLSGNTLTGNGKANWYEGSNPVDLGSNFYAAIIKSNSWIHLGSVNGNVQLVNQNEVTDASDVWYFSKQDDGSYVIYNCLDNNVLDVNGAGITNGTNIGTYPYWGHDAQKWFIYGRWNGEYILRSKLCDKVVDVSDNSDAIGTNVKLWSYNNSGAQQMAIYKLDKVGESVLSIVSGDSITETKFNWTEASNATIYNLRIKSGVPGNMTEYRDIWGIKETSYSMVLPAGYYEVYVDAANKFSYTASNTVSFAIKGSVLGDVDNNGTVNIDDVTLIQKYLVSVSNFTTAQKEFADVNNDGEVNIDDATVMQKYLAGAIAKLG